MMQSLLLALLALLLSSSVVATTQNNNNIRDDFIRAMDRATERKNLAILESKLRNAVISGAGRALADNNDDAYALNLTEYALKYVGCQNIKSFSDDLAEDEDSTSVLGLNKFVVFRLCPADKCSSYNKYGCMDNFGEYLLEMELYLQIMEEYHYEKYLEYCATCIECMAPDDIDDDLYYVNMTDDQLYYGNMSNYTDDDDAWAAEKDCEYFSACKQYSQACKSYANVEYGVQYENYFECAEFDAGDQVMYLGPHCGDDGITLKIGIFSDEDCTIYAGDEVDMNYFTGMAFADDGMEFYSNPSCVSCVSSAEYGLYNDDAAGSATYELCEMMYDYSGKCNRYLDVGDISVTYESSQQEDNELRVCNFIESLMENNYDEYGEIIVEPSFNSFDITNWQDPEEYVNIYRQVTPVQIFGICASLFLVLFLMVYAIYLYAKMRRIHYQRSKNRYPTYQVDVGDRQPSGVMMMRSESGTFA